MAASRRVRRDAKQLLRLCLKDDRLDEERSRQVVRHVAESDHRSRLAILKEFHRLVAHYEARRTARVESALPLVAKTRETVVEQLQSMYGPGLQPAFVE